MNLKHIVRVLAGILLVSGAAALFMPVQVADFVGLMIEPNSANGIAEVGAVYGGIPLALGAIALYSTASLGTSAGPMLAAVGFVFVGAAMGRLIVAFMGSMPTLTGWLFFGFEVVAAVVFLVGSSALEPEV